MKSFYSLLCCTVIACCHCTHDIYCETTEVLLSNAMKCTKEELMTFFPQQIVESVLIKAGVAKEQAAQIALELSQKDKELAKTVEEKASKMEQNPFKDLSQRALAVKLYQDTLYEIFSKSLKDHGATITNTEQIQNILEEIKTAKSKLFVECIRKQQPSPAPSP
jgi:predicted  nucleic acid-binding Zn-ribbon protein